MRRMLMPIAVAAVLAATSARAQDVVPDAGPRTGDAWVDGTLVDIGRYAGRYPDAFVDEMTRYHAAPRALVDDLLMRGWSPGDVYFACALAQVAGEPCRSVAQAWDSDHAGGWGAIAGRLGIVPGSPAFQRIKGGITAAYGHWARPLPPAAAMPAGTPAQSAKPPPAGTSHHPPRRERPRGKR